SGREQADITGMIGQYAHGNEPSHHVAYLYNYAGAPWKTAYYVRRILDSLYSPGPDGLCGNDDCGQMSAWYVMSALGFYQVCAGQPIYCLGSPLFPRATIHLQDGKAFEISAPLSSPTNKYIQASTLNGKTLKRSFLGHADIMNGGVLGLVLGAEPNMLWAEGG